MSAFSKIAHWKKKLCDVEVLNISPSIQWILTPLFVVEIKQCQNPEPLRNGKIVGLSENGKTDVGVAIDYSCNDGNSMMVGPQRRFCKLDGSWSGFQPQCLNPKAGILNNSDMCNSIFNWWNAIVCI